MEAHPGAAGKTFLIPQERSYGMSLSFVLVLPLLLFPLFPLVGASTGQWAFAVFLVLLLALFPAVELCNNGRIVRVDPVARTIAVGNRMRKSRIKTFPIALFACVRTFNTLGKWPKTRVELVAGDGKLTVLLAQFDAGVTKASSFFSLQRYCENVNAAELRKTFSSLTGVTDLGYLGFVGFDGKVPTRKKQDLG